MAYTLTADENPLWFANPINPPDPGKTTNVTYHSPTAIKLWWRLFPNDPQLPVASGTR
jgi:hypothetical protein